MIVRDRRDDFNCCNSHGIVTVMNRVIVLTALTIITIVIVMTALTVVIDITFVKYLLILVLVDINITTIVPSVVSCKRSE